MFNFTNLNILNYDLWIKGVKFAFEKEGIYD